MKWPCNSVGEIDMVAELREKQIVEDEERERECFIIINKVCSVKTDMYRRLGF